MSKKIKRATSPGRPKGPDTKILYCRLPLPLHDAIRADAEAKGQTVNRWIVRALEEVIGRFKI